MSRLRKSDKERHQNLCRLQKVSMQDLRSQNTELLHRMQAVSEFTQSERAAETSENKRRAVRGKQESYYGIREKKGAVEKMRPIDADALKRELVECCNINDPIFGIIRNCQTIDYAPVVHGWWVFNPQKDGYLWKCSECNSNFEQTYRYCPYCGAKME